MFEFNYKRIKSRAITAENFTGEKGRGGMATEGTGKAVSADLGRTFKISPSVIIAKKSTFTVCDIKGSGEVRHVWVTCAPVGFQGIVAEFFYDGADFPSVSIPLGKLFAIGGDNPSDLFRKRFACRSTGARMGIRLEMLQSHCAGYNHSGVRILKENNRRKKL